MNGFDNASKPPITLMSRLTTTTLTMTLMTMERREEARWHNKQRQQRIQTAKYIDVKTNDGAAGGGATAGEGAVRDKQ
jgi:hypothetical protein